MEYGYIICVRRNLDSGKRYVDSLMDVSEFIDPRFVDKVHSTRAKSKLKNEDPTTATVQLLAKLQYVETLRMRARMNMMDGPLYIRTENPVSWDDWDAFVEALDDTAYRQFCARYKF